MTPLAALGGIDTNSQIVQISAHCFIQFGGMVFSAVAVERAGRRPLLMASGVLAGISLLALSTYFFLEEYKCNAESGIASG